MTDGARHRLILVAFCAASWLPGLPARTLWPTDEPRYALIARDMAERGDYIVPIKRGEVYHSQPPLFLWSEILSARVLGGMSEAAARVPSFLAGLGCVLATYTLAASLFGAGAGLLSALVLATDVRFLLSAQWVATDMLLCFFVTATLACFHRAWKGASPGWYYAMYAMAGLGTMTKGPAGFVLPGMVILCCLIARRDLREVLRMRLPAGVLIVAAIMAPWLLLFWRQAGTEEVANLVLKQSFQRYTDAWNNIAPWYYFLWRFPLDFLPWALIFPLAAWASFRRMEAGARAFLWSWFGVIFLFFSASTGKRGVYILPLHPAAAILVGWLCDLAPSRRSLRALTAAIGAAFAAAGILLWTPLPSRLGLGAEGRSACLALGAILAVSGVVTAVLKGRRAVVAVAAGTSLAALAGVLLLAPLENRRQNITGFSEAIARHVPEGAPLGIVRDRFEDLIYYSHRDAEAELRPGRRLTQWLARPDTVYAVLDGPAWEDLGTRPDGRWQLLERATLAGEEYYLIVKR